MKRQHGKNADVTYLGFAVVGLLKFLLLKGGGLMPRLLLAASLLTIAGAIGDASSQDAPSNRPAPTRRNPGDIIDLIDRVAEQGTPIKGGCPDTPHRVVEISVANPEINKAHHDLMRRRLITSVDDPNTTILLVPNVVLDFTDATDDELPLSFGPCVTLTSVSAFRHDMATPRASGTGAAPPRSSPPKSAPAARPNLGNIVGGIKTEQSARTPHSLGLLLKFGPHRSNDEKVFLEVRCEAGFPPNDGVRISCFRIHGPSFGQQLNDDIGIHIRRCLNVEVSNREIAGWGGQWIQALDDPEQGPGQESPNNRPGERIGRPDQVRIFKNYIHHNQHPRSTFDNHTGDTGGYEARRNLVQQGGVAVAERPTKRVSSAAELEQVLRSDFVGRVVIPRAANWEMVTPCGGRDEFGRCFDTPMRELPLKSGVQLVGERGPLGSRPTLRVSDMSTKHSLLQVTGFGVLVEGLRFRGPKPAADHAKRAPYVDAIEVVEDAEQKLGRNVLIRDNEFEQWTGGGVSLIGAHGSVLMKDWDPAWKHLERKDAGLVRIEGNYFHHNTMDGGGYGVVVGGGAYGTIIGNVFDTNRHAVAATGKAYSGYVARFNYVMQGGVMQGRYWNQHFDVHGTANDGYGGYAGEYFEIALNTIRGAQGYYGGFKTRPAFMLRGRPAQGAYFAGNVAVHDNLDAAVSLKMEKGDTGIGEDHDAHNFHANDNKFDIDYSKEVATGDFDGDGRADVFVANGTGWFFSRAGIRHWEFLHASDKRTGDLGFADIDNDSVTDVLYRAGDGKVGFLKGGREALKPLTTAPVPMKELRFGDFDGDRLTDIFFTRNGQWQVWYGRTRQWTPVQTSSASISELQFGEFDRVRGTDVAAVMNGAWSYSSGATQRWAKLNRKLTSSLSGAIAADFDGNGRTDIAYRDGLKWSYSPDGSREPITLRKGIDAAKDLLVGRFDVGSRAQLVRWEPVPPLASALLPHRFQIWRGLGSGDAFVTRSAQSMR
jgi:hypothetical protein